jgi:ubiquinone/menaquinone biosynthesis C-methylase UbiE
MSTSPLDHHFTVADWRSKILEAKHPPERVGAIYTRLAPVYELWARLTESGPRRRVLELAEVRDGESVLEVATGTGAQLVDLASADPSGRVAGIEISDGMLAQTRRRLRQRGLDRVELRRGDARRLPFEDESFDLVVNGYMLDLLPRDEIPRVLAEFRRVLRPGGRLVLSNMTRGERRAHRIWDALYARGIVLTRQLPRGAGGPGAGGARLRRRAARVHGADAVPHRAGSRPQAGRGPRWPAGLELTALNPQAGCTHAGSGSTRDACCVRFQRPAPHRRRQLANLGAAGASRVRATPSVWGLVITHDGPRSKLRTRSILKPALSIVPTVSRAQ